MTNMGPWEIHYTGKAPATKPAPATPAAAPAKPAAGLFADIKAGKAAPGAYKIEGLVLTVDADGLTVAEYNADGERLVIQSKNTRLFEAGQRYGFSIRVTERPSSMPGQAVDVELGR